MSGMEAAGSFVNQKLNTAVPWTDLVASNNLQKVLHAIVQRLDRHDQALAGKAPDAAKATAGKLTVVSEEDMLTMKNRLEVLENTTLQNRVEQLSPLQAVAAKAQSGFQLGQHVIPLTQMKKRIESCEVGIEANGQAVDATQRMIADTAAALHRELEEAIAKLATKEELWAVEAKHDQFVVKADKRMDGLQKDIDRLVPRVDKNEERINALFDEIIKVREEMEAVRGRMAALEEEMPLKADKAEVEAAIKEIWDELEKINIEEIMEMVRKANERIDLMDERCDKIEDGHNDLKESVMKWQKEMEDLQLERQIENLRRELQEAKTGVFLKATQRMDAMQQDAEDMKATLATTQGVAQVNRENIEDLEDIVRQHDPNAAKKGGGVREIVAGLQSTINGLEAKYAEFAAREQEGTVRFEQTEAKVVSMANKLEEVSRSKADRAAMELALQVKADKEMVARDTERNLRAVDEALGVMNAGTQGVQQMLEAQEGVVVDLASKLQGKPDRDELLEIKDQLATSVQTADQMQQAKEAEAGKYGTSLDHAALMTRPMKVHQCLSCGNSLRPSTAHAVPALPLLPQAKDMVRQHAYVPRRSSSAMGIRSASDSLIEVSELPRDMRTAGGIHTSPAKMRQANGRTGSTTTIQTPNSRKPMEVVGDDGRVYQGRVQLTRRGSTGK